MYPRYKTPLNAYAMVIGSMLSGRKKNIRLIAMRILIGMTQPPVVFGEENISEDGPFLLTMNHYTREGFSIIWAAAAISALLPGEPLWVMTNAWTNRSGFFDQIRTNISKAVFTRFAEVFGLITMPSMPPHPDEMMDRAISIRKLFKQIDGKSNIILCLAPEGQDQTGGLLGKPHPGTGKFIYSLYSQLERVLPVGIYEQQGRLVVEFGPAYELEDNKTTDQEVINQVMRQIGNLIPEEFIPER